MKTQNQEVLAYLKTGKSITASVALREFRCFRLAARIRDLRDDGHNIVSITKKQRSKRTGRIVRFCTYTLGDS